MRTLVYTVFALAFVVATSGGASADHKKGHMSGGGSDNAAVVTKTTDKLGNKTITVRPNDQGGKTSNGPTCIVVRPGNGPKTATVIRSGRKGTKLCRAKQYIPQK